MKKIIFLMSFLLVFTAAPLLQAQENQRPGSGFRISPTRYEVTVNRGEAETREIAVRNITNDVKTASAMVEDFAASDDESGQPRLLIGEYATEDNPYSLRPFVQPINDVVLQPGEEKNVLVTIAIPDDASPGSYFGVVRFFEGETASDDQANVSLSASVGTIFLVQVPGETVDLLTLEEITAANVSETGRITKKSRFFTSAPDAVLLRIKNEGNTFQAPFGKIIVRNWSDEVVYEYELNGAQQTANVLPESIRAFTHEIENVASFGRYTIEGNISYGDGGSIITARTTFWVLPVVPILVAGLVLVGGIYAATRGLKSYNRMVIRRSKGERVKKK